MTGNDNPSLAWKEVETRHIVQNEWIDFREKEYEFPDGTQMGPFYNYSRKSYVVIVASDEKGKFLCVQQYRQGVEEVTTELPAGCIESFQPHEVVTRKDRPTEEEAFTAAKRELQEETGYVSDEWKHLITIPSNATLADNYAYVYQAVNCRKISGLRLDDTEYLEPLLMDADEIEQLIAEGKFQQAVHVMAWLLARR